uniref:NB-ARC domain-containing protein n=1 Tax=Quercus lobata TaxID=97700 RepID=A0A7N2L7U1_QUELO
MNFLDKIEHKIFDWVLAALGCVLAELGCYLIRYKSNVDNLKTQVKELRGARYRLQRIVDTARGNLMKIEDDVKRRLTESDDIIAVAGIILEDDKKGWWLNIMSRYQVSKRADKAALEAKNLKDEILKFDGNSVGYHEPTQVVETATSNRGYEVFESRRLILTDVLKALENPDITRIGVYGMGGIGKTMLVKEVLKQAEKEKLFDKYLFLVVSNDPDLKRIQREIAEQLDLKLEVESELGCKLLLTSRLQNTLRDMGTQKQFPVEVLSDNEAISLFEKIVGYLAGEFKSKMPQIVKECAGLPIAITTVANALKNRKIIDVWKYALNQLKNSRPIEIVGTDEKPVYESIKLSYDFLPDEEKSLLLLCSLHGEDYDITIEDSLKYAVGWDLLKNDHKIEDARSTVHKSVEGLKDSCLLLDGKNNGTIKCMTQKEGFSFRQKGFRKESKDTVAIPDSFFEGLKDLKVLKLSEAGKSFVLRVLRVLRAFFVFEGSRQMIWMILLRMFSDFGVEVLEVLEGFEA